MKIIVFTASMGKGGSERVLSYLVREMVQQGDDVSLYLLIDPSVAYPLPNQVSVHFIRKYKKKVLNLLCWIKSIRRVVKQTDVVISFAYKINIIVYFASLGLKKKLIFSERTHPHHDGRTRFGISLCNNVYRRIDCLVVQNKPIQQCFSQGVIDNSVVISNPVEKGMDFAYQYDSNQIIAVGRLIREKNFGLLIDAFSIVRQKLPHLILVILGEGNLRHQLTKQIYDLNLNDCVELPGVVDDVFMELSKSSLFVQTSIFEGQSNALLEALVHGLPVVVTQYDGVEDVVHHGVNGWITPPEIKQLAEMIVSVITDLNSRKNASNKARIITNDLAPEAIFAKWRELLL